MPRLPLASPGSRRRRLALLSGLGLLWALLALSHAAVPSAITGDGTLGTTVTRSGTLYDITGGTRPGNGPNLFHSFDRFSVGTGDTARFSGSSGIVNILSRVTGGQPSAIDGRLQSTIPGANLYLLNPSGVLFGPNASLDVGGSFHVSTADYLRFTDGARFSASLGQGSLLTVASLAAFGFLGSTPAPITIQGGTLQVGTGHALSVVGGDINIVGGRLSSGQLLLASVAVPGEAVLNPLGAAVGSFAHGGQIVLSQGAFLSTSSTSGGSAGDVVVKGERVMLTDGAQIVSSNFGVGRGGDVTIVATNTISIAGPNSGLFTKAGGPGPGGHLQVQASTIELRDGGIIAASSAGAGDAGTIRLQAGEIFRSQDGTVTTAFRPGRRGRDHPDRWAVGPAARQRDLHIGTGRRG
jgi:filamentous hemagglutinin family protein